VRIQITCSCRTTYSQKLRRQLGRETTAKLVSALVISRLDYCNAVGLLASLPITTLAPLQRVLNTAARTALDARSRDSRYSGITLASSHCRDPSTNSAYSLTKHWLVTHRGTINQSKFIFQVIT